MAIISQFYVVSAAPEEVIQSALEGISRRTTSMERVSVMTP